MTDNYIAKTIEIAPYKINDLVIYENKEKSVIVIGNTLILGMGKCCDEDKLKYYEYPEGWSFYIAPGYLHRYGATDTQVRLIEVASPQLDERIVIGELPNFKYGGEKH